MAHHSVASVPIGAGRQLALDITHPAAANGIAVVLLHGGAWQFGQRADMAGYATALAGHGFLAVAAEYRLLGEAAWPAQRDDVLAVVDWLAAAAPSLGIRPDRIVLEGFSAGGHLALLAAAARPSVIGGVVAFFAPPSVRPDPAARGPTPGEMLLGPAPSAAAIAEASPIDQIGAGFPPCFLLAGADDTLVPPEAALAMFHRLRQHGVAADLHIYAGHTHEFCRLPSMLAPVQAEVAQFLQRQVVDPEAARQENLALNMFAQPGGPPLPPMRQPARA